MKRLFGTPKRAIILAICAAAVIAAVSVIVIKNTLITRAEAQTAALRDAGLSEAEVSALRARLEFDDGRFQYEVDFYSNGTVYEYFIQAKDGDIIARDIEGEAKGNHLGQDPSQDAGSQSAADEDRSAQTEENAQDEAAADEERLAQTEENVRNQAAADENSSSQSGENAQDQAAADRDRSAQTREGAGNQSAAGGNSTAQSQGKSLDEAKAAALSDAGLSESDVTFKKTELDHDHGIQVYDIEFFTSDTEYEYEINASDGTVVEKSIESFQTRTNQTDSKANSSNNNYIGVDRAKEIALNHANLNESDVQFAKAKLENDDGRMEYEIEFYVGRTEYDYTIDAVSGNILEYDVEYD